MRKFLLFLAVSVLGLAGTARATLWEFYQDKGGLPSVEERIPQAKQCGIDNYTGTAQQNESLEACLRGDKLLSGYNPVTGYQSRTTAYISASATTIPVASTKDPAGNQIDLSNISSAGTVKVYLNLEPGTNKEEPIVCTGVTPTSWTGCTRGLSFQGSSEAASSTLQKAHNAGAVIVMTNIGQFYNQYVPTYGAFDIYDVKNFFSFPTFNTSTQLPTTDGQFATKYYVDTVGAGGFTSVNASTTRGLEVYGTSPETVGVKASSTLGMAFDPLGSLYQKVVTSSVLTQTSNGIALNASSTRSAGVVPIVPSSGYLDSFVTYGYSGSGSDGALTLTSGNTNIDCAGARVCVKDYTSFSLTGNASITFINPSASGTVVFVKVAGNATISSTASIAIDLRNMGSGAGSLGAGGSGVGSAGTSGTTATDPKVIFGSTTYHGKLGTGALANYCAGTGGQGGKIYTTYGSFLKNVPLAPGAGGAGGGGGGGGTDTGSGSLGGNGGNGGRGAGSLLMTVGGDFTFTTGTISAAGTNGSNGTNGSSAGGWSAGGSGGGGGGGGGGAGGIIITAKGEIVNNGTFVVTGGTGGSPGTVGGSGGIGQTWYGGGGGGGGGGGASLYNSATDGASGGGTSCNSQNYALGQTGGAGGNGGAGWWEVTKVYFPL